MFNKSNLTVNEIAILLRYLHFTNITNTMKRLLLAAMLFAAISANAQIDEKNEVPFINVTGTAEKEVVSDIIYITISLADKVVNKDNYTITAQDNKLKEGLRSISIDVKNLALSGAS